MLKSASKIVFVLFALTACVGFFLGLLPVEQFMIISLPIFAYYFTREGLKQGINSSNGFPTTE